MKSIKLLLIIAVIVSISAIIFGTYKITRHYYTKLSFLRHGTITMQRMSVDIINCDIIWAGGDSIVGTFKGAIRFNDSMRFKSTPLSTH